MIKIIPKQSFKNIPWKNGEGVTLELAINDDGHLADFEWRLSIAKVDKDGEFSDFSGYTRNLVLISGKGVILSHNENQIDRLNSQLDFSIFDGGNKTIATLVSGPITNFNLMTKTKNFVSSVETFSGLQNVILKNSLLCFIYGLDKELEIISKKARISQNMADGGLMQIFNNKQSDLVVTGQNFIVAYIDRK